MDDYGCEDCGSPCECCCGCDWTEEPSYTPSLATGQFDAVPKTVLDIFSSPASGGFFPTLKNKSTKKKENTKMAKAASFKVVVKNGHEDYKFDVKSGQYKTKTVDYVTEFTTFGEALAEFLSYVTDTYNEDKVSLTFVPAKKS